MPDIQTVTVTPTAKLMAEVVLHFDGYDKVLTVKEGDIVKNLRYTDLDGNERTVTGTVRVIRFTSLPYSNDVECVCDANVRSVFSEKVSVYAMSIDCSSKYNADIEIVNMDNILDFEEVESQVMVVTDVTNIDNDTLTFKSTNTPVVVMVNGEIVDFVYDADTETYMVTLPSLLEKNTLVVIDNYGRYTDVFDGNKPVAQTEEKIVESANELSVTIYDNYYNKYHDGDRPDIADEDYYVIIANEVGNVPSILINGDEYTADKNVALSIGMNAFIEKPAFKVMSNRLGIAMPVLAANANNEGKVIVTINGTELTISLFSAESQVKLVNAVSYNKIEGYTNEISLSTNEEGKQVVTQVRNHGHFAAAFQVTVDDQPLTADMNYYNKITNTVTNTTSYSLSKPSKITLEGGETIYGPVLYSWWNSNNNGVFQDESELQHRVFDYTLTFPGKGSVNFIIDCQDVMKEEATEEPTEPDTEATE